MNNQIRFALLTASWLLPAMIIAGCANQSGYASNRKHADERYHKMRGQLMLPLATQQFEAGDLAQAHRTVNEALQINPQSGPFHVLAGRIALERNRLELAHRLFNKATELDKNLAKAHYYKGLVYQRWNQFSEAMGCYQRAYNLKPDRPGYLLTIGEMLVALDRPAEALELFKSKLTYFANNAGLRSAIAQLYIMHGDHHSALGYLREANLLAPQDMHIREILAMTQLEVGQADLAIRNLRSIIAQTDNHQRTDLERSLARAYAQTGRITDARSLCQRLIRKDRADHQAWLTLGEIAWSGGDTATALHAAKRVIELAPNNHDGYLLAGMVWHKRDQIHKAIEMFNAAATAAPTKSTAVILHGIALERSGNIKEAVTAYKEAIRRHPQDNRAKELLAKIHPSGKQPG
tara:strand:- start:759 stop:1976 length:1218 start_codon:yes stop_codon:yes gene_type:complete